VGTTYYPPHETPKGIVKGRIVGPGGEDAEVPEILESEKLLKAIVGGLEPGGYAQAKPKE
jgi:hypothetical protein